LHIFTSLSLADMQFLLGSMFVAKILALDLVAFHCKSWLR